jgi:hypothetical protein
MTEQTAQNTAAGKAAPTADELALVDDRLADVGKDETALWAEFDEADGVDKAEVVNDGAKAADDRTDDDVSGGDAGADAGKTAEPVADPSGAATDGQQKGAGDIWANATPEQRAELDRLRSEASKAKNEAKAQSGRQAALQRRVNELQKMLQPRAGEAPKPKDALAGIAQDFPEIAEPLTKALEPIAERLNENDTTRRQAAHDELAGIIEEQTSALLEKHGDYEDVLAKNAAAFTAWVNDPRTPQGYVQAAHRNANAIVDADGAIAVMDAFKASLQPPAAAAPAQATEPNHPVQLNDRRQRQLDASASPRPSNGRPVISGIPKDGDAQAIWDAFDAQEARRA